jgi:hypothetical protein
MHDTATMARATDRFQLSAMRINFAQKCGLPEYTDFEARRSRGAAGAVQGGAGP